MAFRKTIAPKTFKLPEHPLRVFQFVSFGCHAINQLLFKLGNQAFGFKSCHTSPQPIGLCRGKTRCYYSDFHSLLLK